MAIGYGLGIGLQGTPKDYVDIIRSRDAAAAKNAAAKAAREAKKLERVERDFIKKISTTKVLPIHQKIVDEKVAEFNAAMEEEIDNDTQDINRINRIATQIGVTMNELAVAKSNWDKIGAKATTYGFTPEEARLLSYESDPNVWVETLDQFGSSLVSFDPTTLKIGLNPIDKYKTVGQIFNEYTNEGTNPDMYDYNNPKGSKVINGTKMEIFKINPVFADDFTAQNLTNPSIDVEMTKEYRVSGKALPQFGTPQYINEKTKYLKDKFLELSNNYEKPVQFRPPGQTRVFINNTKEQESIGAPSFDQGSNVYLGQMKSGQNQDYNYYGTFSYKTTSFVGGVPSDMYNIDDNSKVTTGGGTLTTSSLHIVPVFKNITSSTIQGKDDKLITFAAGTIIPVSMEDAEKKKGNVKYELVGIGSYQYTSGTTTTNIPVKVPGQQAVQSMSASITNENVRKQFNIYIDNMNKKVNELNGGKPSGGSSSGRGTTARDAAGKGM
jgi:hypothetical protein